MSEELDDLDAEKGKQLAATGKMNDGFALDYAMDEGFQGTGTDDRLPKGPPQGKDRKGSGRPGAGSTGPLYVVCKSGGRGRQACEKFEKAGFTLVATRQWNKASPVRPIMRLALG